MGDRAFFFLPQEAAHMFYHFFRVNFLLEGLKADMALPVSNQRGQNHFTGSKPEGGLKLKPDFYLGVWVVRFCSSGLKLKPSGKFRVAMWTFLKVQYVSLLTVITFISSVVLRPAAGCSVSNKQFEIVSFRSAP